MGGSIGGGIPLGQRNLNRLEQAARESLREGASTGPSRRNVFISFASEDLGEVNMFRGQAKNQNNELEFSDRSLQKPFNSENEEYIKRGIRERIRQASVTLVYVSENTSQSEWVDWEIRESIRLGKGIIAVHKGDSPPRNLPAAVRENNIDVVPWEHTEISEAIDRAAVQRTPSD